MKLNNGIFKECMQIISEFRTKIYTIYYIIYMYILCNIFNASSTLMRKKTQYTYYYIVYKTSF